VHFGAIAVTDTQGRLITSAGNGQWLIFTLSTLNPFQGPTFMQDSRAAHFRLDDAQLALPRTSHNGEAMPVAQEDWLLAADGLTYKCLQCGCHAPCFKELSGGARRPV
jgi:L-asparaginase II